MTGKIKIVSSDQVRAACQELFDNPNVINIDDLEKSFWAGLALSPSQFEHAVKMAAALRDAQEKNDFTQGQCAEVAALVLAMEIFHAAHYDMDPEVRRSIFSATLMKAVLHAQSMLVAALYGKEAADKPQRKLDS